eukprot:1597896-Rhodomonas_salina.1
MRKVNEEEEETRKVNKEQGPEARGESRERDKNEMKQRGGRGGDLAVKRCVFLSLPPTSAVKRC